MAHISRLGRIFLSGQGDKYFEFRKNRNIVDNKYASAAFLLNQNIEHAKAVSAREEYERNVKKRRKDIFAPATANQELSAGGVQTGGGIYSA